MYGDMEGMKSCTLVSGIWLDSLHPPFMRTTLTLGSPQYWQVANEELGWHAWQTPTGIVSLRNQKFTL